MIFQSAGGRRGRRPASLFPLLFSLFLILPACPLQAEDTPYLASLLAEARQKNLSEDPYWRTLLHYKKSLTGYKSQVDDPRFFLSPQGKTDPAGELEADLRGLFDAVKDEKDHPACRFIGRAEWLKERLAIEPSSLPLRECSGFNELLNRIRPASATLIFPAAHINSPASMFGHTLLTIDTVQKSRLLAYAINYSAVTRETFGPLFAVKGLFGFYPGYFSLLPYYAKLQEYSDTDNRDIWEYPLNLNEEEIRRLLLHSYEMNMIYSDYYFFDENCSYDLLFLLDAARPGVELTDQFFGWVIPADTIRKVTQSGMAREAIYRPSLATRIRHGAARLSAEERSTALAIAGGKMEPEKFLEKPMALERKERILDVAGQYLQYRYAKDALTIAEFQERFWKILRARSHLGTPGEEERIRPPVRPDEGHFSNRFRAGLGVRSGRVFEELAFRPAYHDLLDNDKGYVEGAQIVFGDAALRYYSSERKLLLQRLDVIDIISLSPRDSFFSPFSWKIRTGLNQQTGTDGEDHLVFHINPGGGWSYKVRPFLFYLFVEGDLETGGGLEKRLAVGAGGSAGLIGTLTDFWKLHLFTRDIYYGLVDNHNTWEAGLQQSFFLTTNSSIRLDVGISKIYGIERTEAGLSWNYFF